LIKGGVLRPDDSPSPTGGTLEVLFNSRDLPTLARRQPCRSRGAPFFEPCAALWSRGQFGVHLLRDVRDGRCAQHRHVQPSPSFSSASASTMPGCLSFTPRLRWNSWWHIAG